MNAILAVIEGYEGDGNPEATEARAEYAALKQKAERGEKIEWAVKKLKDKYTKLGENYRYGRSDVYFDDFAEELAAALDS